MEVKQLYDSNGEPFYPKTAASSQGGLIGGIEGDGIAIIDLSNNRYFINGFDISKHNLKGIFNNANNTWYIDDDSLTSFKNNINANLNCNKLIILKNDLIYKFEEFYIKLSYINPFNNYWDDITLSFGQYLNDFDRPTTFKYEECIIGRINFTPYSVSDIIMDFEMTN